MTSGVQASAAAAAMQADIKSVTIGTPGASVFGAVPGSYGALSSPNLKGLTLLQITAGATSFAVSLTGVVTISFFLAILVQNTAGAWVRLESSAATFTNPGGTNSQWIWALGAGPWTNLSPSPRSAQFIY